MRTGTYYLDLIVHRLINAPMLYRYSKQGKHDVDRNEIWKIVPEHPTLKSTTCSNAVTNRNDCDKMKSIEAEDIQVSVKKDESRDYMTM